MWEEVDQVTISSNYGWRCREGAHDFNSGGTAGCGAGGLIDPVAEYDHTLGISITGGYVYRGTQNTNLVGRLPVRRLRLGAHLGVDRRERDAAARADAAARHRIEHLVVRPGERRRAVRRRTTAARCITSSSRRRRSAAPCRAISARPAASPPAIAQQPAAGLIPYAINAPFWSDGATKERWLAVPDGQTVTVRTDGDWDFPNRSVLMKNFRVGTRLIETRLLMRHPDGTWGGFTYEWNAQQTDATLVEGGAERDIGNGQNWSFPSEGAMPGVPHGRGEPLARAGNLAAQSHFTYSQTGRTANELATLSHIGLLSPPIADSAAQPAMPDPADASAPLGNRARAYLHTNCSQCHRPNGPTPSTMDLRYTTALNATNACNATPQAGDLGIGANARLIAPGSSANSVARESRQPARQQRHAAARIERSRRGGVALLTQWIDGLTGC